MKLASAVAPSRNNLLVEAILVTVISVVGFFRVAGTWWFHDDWVFLADAAGVAARDHSLVRFVSFDLYWKAFYELFGLTPVWWGLSRLLLHAGCAFLALRIARLTGLGAASVFLAGALFATNPATFEAVYWGTGAVELLGAIFALAAVERWLASGRTVSGAAAVLAALAIFSKESGLLLPLLFALLTPAACLRRPRHWVTVGLLAALAVYEAFLVRADLGQVQSYEVVFGPLSILGNLATAGFWFVSPPPFARQDVLGEAMPVVLGGLIWTGWALHSCRRWRRDRDKLPACLLLAALLALIPVLPLASHLVPRYVYAAAAPFFLWIAGIIGGRVRDIGNVPRIAIAIGLTLYALTGGDYHRDARHDRGRPLNWLVLKSGLSKMACDGLSRLPLQDQDRLVFWINPEGDLRGAETMRDALAGNLGPRVLLGEGIDVEWTDRLRESHRGAFVVEVNGITLHAYGRYQTE